MRNGLFDENAVALVSGANIEQSSTIHRAGIKIDAVHPVSCADVTDRVNPARNVGPDTASVVAVDIALAEEYRRTSVAAFGVKAIARPGGELHAFDECGAASVRVDREKCLPSTVQFAARKRAKATFR